MTNQSTHTTAVRRASKVAYRGRTRAMRTFGPRWRVAGAYISSPARPRKPRTAQLGLSFTGAGREEG